MRMRMVGNRVFVRRVNLVTVYQADNPSAWTTEATFAVPSRSMGDDPVNSFDADGNTIVDTHVGFAYAGSTTPSTVYVYRRNAAGAWVGEGTLPDRATPPVPWAWGSAVAVSGDRIAVGANWEPGTGLTGYVRVFHRTAPGVWELESDLVHPTLSAGQTGFGIAVDLTDDRLLVGTMHDSFGGPGSGGMHLFQRTGSAWNILASYAAGDTPGALVGLNVAFAGDQFIASGYGLDGSGGAIAFDACSLPPTGDTTPRCLPGVGGLLTYFEAFFTGNAFADYNRDTFITVQDAFDFLDDWFAGCP
jgi:hypothetical protein